MPAPFCVRVPICIYGLSRALASESVQVTHRRYVFADACVMLVRVMHLYMYVFVQSDTISRHGTSTVMNVG